MSMLKTFDGLIPGLQDFVEDIPVPTQEEGGNTLPEPKNLDDEDPKDPTNVDIVIDIGDSGRSEDTQMKFQQQREQLIAQLHMLEYLSNNEKLGYIGQEGFVSALKNSVTGLANIMGHILNLFKTSLFDGWRDFKRSELAEYSDSNRFTMGRLYSSENFQKVAFLQVDTPKGMIGSYIDAIASLQKFLDMLNMLDRSTKMLRMTETIYTDIVKVNPSFSSHVNDVYREMTPPLVAKYFDETSKIFTARKDDKQQFRTLFKDMREYETCVKQCIHMDSHLRAVASVHSRMEDISQLVDKIIENADKMTRPQVDDLVKMVRMYAETFDRYAVVINDLNRVNHNLTFVTMSIRQALNM